MSSKRVTQHDIATELGMHRSTVSLALRNSPKLPLKTRQEIVAAAKRLGYRPDPMLSALAAYREKNRPQAFEGILAWLVNSVDGYDWRTGPLYQQYYQGAVQQGELRGFRVELFEINSPGMTARRMTNILATRNIKGILVCPQPTSHPELVFPWENFSSVTFGYTLKQPNLHRITATQFRGLRTMFDKVRELGYERIGVTLTDQMDKRTDNNYLSAYALDEYNHDCHFAIPVLKSDIKKHPESLIEWVKKYQIDAVVSPDDRPLPILQRYGIRTPEDIGFVSCNVASTDSDISGICENSLEIGRAAVDFLVAMIHRGEIGVPEYPRHVLVDGTWCPGKTLRAKA